jgi:cytochrome c oxidase assembly factor 6
MAWFPSWSSGSDKKSSKDGEYEATDRLSRAKCWDARDRYFQCLDKNDILNPMKDEEKAKRLCPSEDKKYEENCATAWVRDIGTWNRISGCSSMLTEK